MTLNTRERKSRMARDHTDYINPNLGWGNFTPPLVFP